MSMEPFAAPPLDGPRRPRRPWLEGVLLLGLVLSLLVGVTALGGLLLVEGSQPEPRPVDPLAGLRPDLIPPQLALRQLAGDAPGPLARQAMQAGYLELAFAVITFDLEMTPEERSGLWLQLARHFQQADLSQRAADLYLLVAQAAILDPTLLPLERGRVLVQCSEGLLAVPAPELAIRTGEQALAVANLAPGMLPAQREQIFEPLVTLFRRAGEESLEAAALELARNPFSPNLATGLENLWPLPEQPLAAAETVLGRSVAEAVAYRQEAAANLAERIRLTNGQDIEPERVTLIQALLEEERVRRTFWESLQAQTPSLELQQWLYREQRAWALLKVRIALGGFGLRLMPEWEANPVPQLQELADATVLVERTLLARIQTIEDPALHAATRFALLQWTAWQSARGIYPGRPIPDLVQGFQDTGRELQAITGTAPLPIVYQERWLPTPFYYSGWR